MDEPEITDEIVTIKRADQDLIVILAKDGTYRVDTELPLDAVVATLHDIADHLKANT